MIAYIAIIVVALVSSSEGFQKLLLTRLVLRPSSASVACAPLSMSTKVERNQNFAKLQAGYLFPEIARRRRAYLEQNPSAKIISLGEYSCIGVV
jgi:hypothetical protein